ncbi:hypothetical protein [Mycoplasma leonicaptivi]|uniref:hypothetical protein n=1 Tax=Mycoplasma leonicaptivi TaxID=36742 RepID=UPI000482C734|nr:hypothetical protein [Mycoplasma leonicaptivi]
MVNNKKKLSSLLLSGSTALISIATATGVLWTWNEKLGDYLALYQRVNNSINNSGLSDKVNCKIK